MSLKQFTTKDAVALQKLSYGINGVAFHYAQKAKQAGDRLKIAISTQNIHSIVFEANALIQNAERVYELLADDNNVINTAEKTTKKK